MSKSITVSVVIPNWNGAQLLAKNLPSVLKAKENLKNKIVEVIVVDDGSADNSIEILKQSFKDVKLVQHTANRGFSAAVNTGVRFAKGTHVCLLNTDVIPSHSFLDSAINCFRDEKVFGITLHEEGYGPAVGYFDGYFKHSGGSESDEIQETFWANGGSSIFSKAIWKELKGLDGELYDPFYWEDVDLGYRARKRGYTLFWVPEAKVVHAHESVINQNNFRKKYLNIIKERNELLFIWKNITSKRLFKLHLKELFNRLKRHPGYIRVVFAAALKCGLVRRRRNREKLEAVVSDEAVFAKFS
ncbi:hypothetical protein A2803_02590 [Candidatus Woesebacteria bacterium RIFCSPHIGHO2_01_FULL_44_21]|uniref:Glycosyltransferase 2-like domain-containing protein n=1 Tax=Candidatus Woesebacteria bacterium RIFCSPHIGHO2_01_FULL_44_21 TaxID=1802503 RepID=A0A1F7YX89_9BACT|nr:MAG: hypothetical protein A2803_02590 [Candidatus Woesebacteria bacterium RIFCSPHIGHO2_01_FULL_44_21]OGM69840.1 MAG: hypothetical protein A2897_00655 [Candidatus Woesebacteria bacterium RIFCSPLOWO2_01_FULL_44_24b]